MSVSKFHLCYFLIAISCDSSTENNVANIAFAGNSKSETILETINIKTTSLADFIDTCIADGFDYPIGNADGKGSYISDEDGKTYDSWYIATKFVEEYNLGIHTGIDLNGSGGGNTDLGQPVYSIGKGLVVEAKDFGAPWGNVVLIKHKYLENAKIFYCYSLYAHLKDIKVEIGDIVERRKRIGRIDNSDGSFPAHLHLEIRKEKMSDYDVTYWPSSNSKDVKWVKEYYEDPEVFIKNHRVITCPYKENEIIMAFKSRYTMYYYEKGKKIKEYEIALSQNPVGHKEMEGDLKLPEGEYYIVEKEKGPFYGNYAAFLGPRILRISYPNTFDAINGYKKGIITKSEYDAIISAKNKLAKPPFYTKLGGKIVIHGWNGDWIADGTQNLTWGCISMHNRDIEDFYELIKDKTKLMIIP